MKQFLLKLRWLLPLGFIALMLFVAPQIASAQTAGIDGWSCATNIVSCGVYFIAYGASVIGGLLIALGAYLVSLVLQQGATLTEVPFVQTGFSITLSIANLGFILGIIIIAISTILRIQSYGIKQILWKLLIMAILVNFSMLFVKTTMGFSDRVTEYFRDAATPGNKYEAAKFVDAMANAFAPQTLFQAPDLNVDTLSGELARGLSVFIKSVLNLVTVIIGTFIIAITFFALAIMLLIRYITLAILIILMPLAWLMWVFPAFSANWTKWWSEFIRWVVFPPIVTFFLYLTLLGFQTKTAWLTQPTTGPQAQGLAALTGNASSFQSLMQIFILTALAMGGIIVANSLSITGAKQAQSAIKSTGKNFGKYVSGKTKAGFRSSLRSMTSPREVSESRFGRAKNFLSSPLAGVLAGKSRPELKTEQAKKLRGEADAAEKIAAENEARLKGKAEHIQGIEARGVQLTEDDKKVVERELEVAAKESRSVATVKIAQATKAETEARAAKPTALDMFSSLVKKKVELDPKKDVPPSFLKTVMYDGLIKGAGFFPDHGAHLSKEQKEALEKVGFKIAGHDDHDEKHDKHPEPAGGDKGDGHATHH